MSAELAHQKAGKHLCVALHRKLRIRLHPSIEAVCGIASNKAFFPYRLQSSRSTCIVFFPLFNRAVPLA